jgi:ferritin
MSSKKVLKALNQQINAELFAAYQYMAMSAYLSGINFPGMAMWMRHQSQEEVEHAMKIFDYVHQIGSKVEFGSIDKPDQEYGDPYATFLTGLEHEQKVTAMINSLYELASEEKDYPTQLMLQWFIDEQVEEEANFSQLVEQFKMAGDNVTALLALDAQLASREA